MGRWTLVQWYSNTMFQAGQAVACPGFDMQSSIVLAAAELTVECGDTRMCHYNFPVSGQSQGLGITLVFTL